MEEKELKVEEVKAEVVDEHNKDGFIYLQHELMGKKMFFYVEKGTPTNVAFDAALDISMHLRAILKQQIEEGMKKANQESVQKEETKVEVVS